MRRAPLLLPLVLAALALPASATTAQPQRHPRLEKLALRPADTARARRALVRRSDLGAGWTRLPTNSSESAPPTCPGYKPDFSAFTITGRAESGFQQRARSILTHVEVYASRADARGDYGLSTEPPAARCLGLTLRRQLAAASVGFTATVASARRVAAPALGERSAAYRIVVVLSSGAARVRIYIDVLVFLQGRAIGGLFFTSAPQPLPGRTSLARRVVARLR
jgi:hypothetical protein